MEQNKLVKISNALTCALYSLSLSEKRLLMLSIIHLDKVTDGKQLIRVTPEEYANFYLLNKKGTYQTLKNTADHLWTRTLVTEDNTKHRWVITSRYEGGAVEIELHPHLKVYLTQLRNHFSQYFLNGSSDFRKTK